MRPLGFLLVVAVCSAAACGDSSSTIAPIDGLPAAVILERAHSVAGAQGLGELPSAVRDLGSVFLAQASRRQVLLPKHANDAMTLRDGTSAIQVRLRDALPSLARLSGGYLVYADAYGQGHHRLIAPHGASAEDFILFERAPVEPVIRYAIDLGKAKLSLRLRDNQVEFLDALGSALYRMTAPFLIDRRGRRVQVQTSLESCPEAGSPQNQVLGQPIDECSIVLTWPSDLGYPALLDPLWEPTQNSLADARAHAVSVTLNDGRVLIVGGENASGPLNSVEIYNPTSRTWTTTT